MSTLNPAVERINVFLGEFEHSPLWVAMERTVEASPWHREANVAVHTRMLLSWYEKNYLAHRNDKQILLSSIACIFHDTGKPVAEVVKESPERGVYRAYHGHELISARLWAEYAISNFDHVRDLLGFSLADVSNVALMIEHHVPFALKDKTKRKNLKTAFLTRMGEEGHQAWLDMLNSDQNGRISDDQPVKLAAVAEWMKAWELV